MAKVRVLCGPVKSARSALLDNLARANWGRVALLTPTQEHAKKRAEQLILGSDLPGWWGRPVTTYNKFVISLLEKEGRNPVQLSDMERQLLLERSLPSGAPAGYYAQMLRVITQLKQAAIEPAAFAQQVRKSGNAGKNDESVAEAYAVYQRALLDAGLYDLPGVFWEADVVCRENKPKILDGVDVLILDGFDDFTPSEFKLLLSLDRHLDLMVFGLACTQIGSQADLYSLPLRTADKIARAFHCSSEFIDAPPPKSYVEFAAANMFWRDAPLVAEELAPNLKVVPCADAVTELEAVARMVKRLLLDGTPAERIAVVYRRIGNLADFIRAVFDECGIPLRINMDSPLWQSGACAFIYNLIAAADAWGREQITDLLCSPWLESTCEDVSAIPFLARVAGIVKGRDEWRERLNALQDPNPDAARALRRLSDSNAAIDGAIARLEALDKLAAIVPEEATSAEFIAAAERLIDAAYLPQAIARPPLSAVRKYEEAALAALRGMLRSWHKWNAAVGKTISRKEFVIQLRGALRSAPFRVKQDSDGVLCTEAAFVRHLEFDHVFFCNANEGSVPQPPPRNAVYSEHDIARLAKLGIELESRRTHIEREALLFNHVLCAAKSQLTITWRRLDERAREQYPSPYVQDAIDLFKPRKIQAGMPSSTAFVPELAEAASLRDVRNRAFMDKTPIRDNFPRTAFGAEIETARDSKAPFGCYDGVLADAAAVQAIAAEYGNDHLFSVKQLETYLKCPFMFYATLLIGMQPAQIPAVEFDAKTRGRILHEALQRFFHSIGGNVSEVLAADANAEMRRIVADVFRRNREKLASLAPSVIEVEQRRVETTLLRHLNVERDKGPGWNPSQFEVSFGRDEKPFSVETNEGPVKLNGQIDRIDTNAGGEVRIIDYKSSKSITQDDIKSGISIQLAVYAMAVEESLPREKECEEAWFVPVGKSDWCEALKKKAKSGGWEERRKIALEAIARALRGIRRGEFPPIPKGNPCRYCEAIRVCRYSEGRIERKLAAYGTDAGTAESD